MLEPIELKAHPYCTDCLSWCADGRLAVAAGEYVFILTPEYVGGRREALLREDPKVRWDVVKLQVNQFTYVEWPQLRHQPLDSFSPGEELSNSHITSLAWSSDGVGPFRRHVLAIQTSNLLLSVWGLEDGNLKWTRLAIINQSLYAYFAPKCNGDRTLLQKRQRIRSFSWSPTCPIPSERQGSSLDEKRGWNYMAVANDNQEVIFLRVNAAKRFTSRIIPLSTDIITSSKIAELDVEESRRPILPGSMLFNILESNKCITDIAWGNWIEYSDPPGVFHSNVAVLHTDRVHLYRVVTSLKSATNSQPIDEVVGTNDRPVPVQLHFDCHRIYVRRREEETLTGPLSWNSHKEVEFELGTSQYSNIRDEISTPADKTIAANHINGAGRAVHAATHLGMICTEVSPTIDEELDADPLLRSIGSRHGVDLQSLIGAVRNRFDLDYDLGGRSVARIWGLAKYNPLQKIVKDGSDGLPDEYLAACFTLHPTEMAEHSMPSAALMRVVISCTSDLDNNDGCISDNDRQPLRTSMAYAQPSMNFIPISFVDDHVRMNARLAILEFDNKWTSGDMTNGLQSARKDPLLRMILYAHSCCCIMDLKPIEEVMRRFSLLRELTGINFSDEINVGYEEPNRRVIKARKVDSDVAALTFEKCTICGSAIPWHDPNSSRTMWNYNALDTRPAFIKKMHALQDRILRRD
ncbi:hypothetical protein KEM54_000007 [Ascosphaera aggregata]|nr:hypothetical protein KEM54_000007 [Ascosphaera aggregata]